MDPALKARLTSRDLWMRLLYMLLFAIAYGVAELVMTVAVIFQFVFILLTGSANEPLLRLGQNLTRYIADIIRFQTFNTEHKPFPFDDWPEETPGGERWRGTGEDDEPPGEPPVPDSDGTDPHAGTATSTPPDEPERSA